MSTWRYSSTFEKNGKASAKKSTRSPAKAASAAAASASGSRPVRIGARLLGEDVAQHDADALARVLGRHRVRAVERAQVRLREVDARREDLAVEGRGEASRRRVGRLGRVGLDLGAAHDDAARAAEAGARPRRARCDLDAEALLRLAQARRAAQESRRLRGDGSRRGREAHRQLELEAAQDARVELEDQLVE